MDVLIYFPHTLQVTGAGVEAANGSYQSTPDRVWGGKVFARRPDAVSSETFLIHRVATEGAALQRYPAWSISNAQGDCLYETRPSFRWIPGHVEWYPGLDGFGPAPESRLME
jgi:hypothetical protein